MKRLMLQIVKPHILGAFLSLGISISSVYSAEFAISSAHPLATKAGVDILLKGGNAFDAAIAVTTTLAVVEPYSSGIGGGGFYLLHRETDDYQIMLDARERAPLLAGRDFYIDDEGKVNHDWSMNGAKSAGIPGIPAALEHLQTKYANLPLSQTLAAAIKISDEGFEVEEKYQRWAGFRKDVINRFPATAEILLRNGEVPEKGELIKQPELANTLRAIAREGKQGFYQGEIAQKLVDSVQNHGGVWTLQDLNQYQLIEREPVRFRFQDADFTLATLPSSGGLVLAEIFNMLSQLDYVKASEEEQVHMLAEAMRRAYRDRAEYMGDTDYVRVPEEMLKSKEYARTLLENFSRDKATPSSSLGSIIDDAAGADTTHFSIVDKAGNRVSATLSVNYPFGSGLIAEGTGVLLNDEMDDFSAAPGVPNAYGLIGSEANAIQPGKRMLSSMTPGFVEMSDRILVSGTPGGSRIITMQLLGILEFLKGGDAKEIVSRPRFHHQFFPDQISFEPDALSAEMQQSLSSKGHVLKEMSYQYGNMQTIVMDKRTGALNAASDPRGIGSAIVVSE